MSASEVESGFSLQQDIAYLGADRAEKMDVYLPSNDHARPLPAVLLIHGGGWRIGDKADQRERNIGSTLASAGYAVFSINYLLNVGERIDGKMVTTKVAWPQSLHDCKSALRYIRRHASTYGVDSNRIGVMGGSAGGSFAMLLGATTDIDAMNAGGLFPEQSNAVSCIVNLYGVPDVQNHRAEIFAGANDEETRQNARDASPVTWLHAKMPPMLILHGTADALVNVDESRKLARRLQELGVDYWYLEIAGAPHSFHLEPAQANLRPLVLTFLRKHL